METYDDFPIASDQIWLRRELIDTGLTDRAIRGAVRAGQLVRLRHGAYVASPLVSGLDAVGLMRARSRAVLKTHHSATVLSHHNALAEYGVPLWDVDFDQTHVTRTDGRPGRREAGVVHHRGKLSEDEWCVRNQVPVVTPARGAVEVALSDSSEAGLIAVCGVLHRGLATMEELKAASMRALRWSNGLHMRALLTRADARLASVAEIRSWFLFFEQRISRPEPQVEVRDEWGHLLGIVDFLWRMQGVFLEFDGKIKYERFRRPGESLDDYVMREKRREEQICARTGWVCIRITWADLENPLNTARRIRALLDSRTKPAA